MDAVACRMTNENTNVLLICFQVLEDLLKGGVLMLMLKRSKNDF